MRCSGEDGDGCKQGTGSPATAVWRCLWMVVISSSRRVPTLMMVGGYA